MVLTTSDIQSTLETEITTMLQSEGVLRQKLIDLWSNDFRERFATLGLTIGEWQIKDFELTRQCNPLPEQTENDRIIWALAHNFPESGTILSNGFVVKWCGSVVCIIGPIATY